MPDINVNDNLILDAEYKEMNWVEIEPPQTPVTILDLERSKGCMDMHLPMADPCPSCGAFNMRVGDWVVSGFCNACWIEAGRPNDF